jgi:tetratricopeptide (TPR) repeat protein
LNYNNDVKIWEEKVVMPTYGVSDPDHNPRFYENRAYQGSSGKVYPLPVTEKILDEKEDKEYNAVFLENKFLRIMFLPELGGRIQRALDKTNNYDFVYYNHVIKPALVGLVGPWISGGIEFNWPQHHRPTTYEPTEYKLMKNEDGSKSLLVSEIDKMYGTKGMASFTLYPDKAYLEIKGQLYNRTDLPQTFLWWANPAVPVNDYTSSIFPPDVTAVMDHGKRAVSTFPIATGEYYKVDYSAGVDISKYKNVPVPTSYMAEKSDYDFIGNYDEQVKAGLLHVADHHVSPGKKQWTWGNGDFGQAWDHNLTDEDGPYIELMTGVFTDNQPDFTWLRPYEEKVFTQYFMPYKGVGYIKNATIDGAINLEKNDTKATVTLYVTGEEKDIQLQVLSGDTVIFETMLDLTPASFYQEHFSFDNKAKSSNLLSVVVKNALGKVIVDYTEVERPEPEIPEPAEPIPAPEELKTTEELFLAATHLEQYRHATREPEIYYLEGLKRDATDIRLNTGYGTLLYRRGQFAKAEKYLLAAVRKQTWKTPNPYYGEPLFQLGLALEIQGKKDEAFKRFYKATWNDDTQSSSFFKLAALSAQKGNWIDALEFVKRSLVKNAHHMKARMLEILIMEELGYKVNGKVEEAIAIDPLDLTINRKNAQLNGNHKEYLHVMRDDLQNYLSVALDYIQYGFYTDAMSVLEECPVDSPMIGYYQAYILNQQGNKAEAKVAVERGEESSSLYCFPSRVEEVVILENVIQLVPDASFAKYYLGNLLYDKKQYEAAIKLWKDASVKLTTFPTVFRNLSFAYYNKKKDGQKALELINKAYKLNPKDARVLLEKTQLEQMLKVPVTDRLTVLEENFEVTAERDDLFIEYLTLLNLVGRCEDVLKLIKSRIFHPWEGGEGKVSAQYIYALTELGRQAINKDSHKARELLAQACVYPRNLGEGKLLSNHDNIANYYLGHLYKSEGNNEAAEMHFTEATKGIQEPGSVLYYNDEPADVLFYQGLAYEQLGNKTSAKEKFKKLLEYGEEHLNDEVEWDFFAVSAPAHSVYESNIQLDNHLYCTYLIGLGKLGLREYKSASEQFEKVLEMNPAHQGTIQHKNYADEQYLPGEVKK